MTTAHNIMDKLSQAGGLFMTRVSETDAETIADGGQWSIVSLKSGGVETRTLADPARPGQFMLLHMHTDGGNITVEADTTLNAAAETTITFTAEGQTMLLISVNTATSGLVWRSIVDSDAILA